MLSLSTLVHAATAHFARVEADLAAQQAVRGLDALDEIVLHQILAAAMESVGWGVLREVPYPGEVAARQTSRSGALRRPRRSERERCDLTLTTEPGQRLTDPVEALLKRDRAEATLFAHLGADPSPGPSAARSEDAIWLEVKTLGQYCFRKGVPGPNPSYASELVGGPARDIAKLARDPHIFTAAAMVVLFCESEQVARHDLAEAANRWLDRDLPITEPTMDGLPIQDRIGNNWCAVAMVRVRAASD